MGRVFLVKGLGFKPCAGQRELSWVSSRFHTPPPRPLARGVDPHPGGARRGVRGALSLRPTVVRERPFTSASYRARRAGWPEGGQSPAAPRLLLHAGCLLERRARGGYRLAGSGGGRALPPLWPGEPAVAGRGPLCLWQLWPRPRDAGHARPPTPGALAGAGAVAGAPGGGVALLAWLVPHRSPTPVMLAATAPQTGSQPVAPLDGPAGNAREQPPDGAPGYLGLGCPACPATPGRGCQG